MTVLYCPKCAFDMREIRRNVFQCRKCNGKWEQLSIDAARYKMIEARMAAGFTSAKQAARELGYSYAYFSNVERGVKKLSEQVIERCMVVYKCRREDLV